MTRRTPATQQRYDQARERGDTIIHVDTQGNRFLDWQQERVIYEYDHWVVIPNRFPYDAIFTVHDLLVPKRHFAYVRDATDEERHEYYQIKKQLDQDDTYESIIENFSRSRSVDTHFHAHLVCWVE